MAEEIGVTIGDRARAIRRRRGMSLDTVAGLAGISESYLSRLERGERTFDRRGLIEDLADALGCSPRAVVRDVQTGTERTGKAWPTGETEFSPRGLRVSVRVAFDDEDGCAVTAGRG